MNEEEIIKKHYSRLGKKGGASLRDSRGKEYFALLGKRSGESKREKKRINKLSPSEFDIKTDRLYITG